MDVNITMHEGVALAIFKDVPDDYESVFFCELFDGAADAGINIDMISQAPATGGQICFGFTFDSADMPKMLRMVNEVNAPALNKGFAPMFSTGNVKIRIIGEMEYDQGFASRTFCAMRNRGVTPLLISTGANEISLVVTAADAENLHTALTEIFAE
jgi:aspartokinase